jgi:hypothetical protein
MFDSSILVLKHWLRHGHKTWNYLTYNLRK